MNTTVFKYDIKPDVKMQYEGCVGAFVELPVDCKIVHVGDQDGVLRMWAMVDPLRRLARRKFLIVPTGGVIHPNAEFIGSVLMVNGLVWHIFEEK